MEIEKIDKSKRKQEIIDEIVTELKKSNQVQHSCDGDKFLAKDVGREFSRCGYYAFLMFYEPHSRFQYLKVAKSAYNVGTGRLSWIEEL